MSKGWFGESRRHSEAARKGSSRYHYTARYKRERIRLRERRRPQIFSSSTTIAQISNGKIGYFSPKGVFVGGQKFPTQRKAVSHLKKLGYK